MKKYNKIPYSDDLIENCLKLIKQNPNITTSQIAKKLNKSPSTIHRLLTYIRQEGLIPSLKKGSASLTPEEYPEKEEENETIEKLKEENEELKEQIKTYEEQIKGINLELIRNITNLELQKIDLEKRINDIKLKLQNTNDYKERSFLKEDLKTFELNYAKLLKELEILKSFLKSK
jgi:predicted transcriptional regulator